MNAPRRRYGMRADLRRFSAIVFAILFAAPAGAYTVTDFSVDPAHATLGDPHQVASPPFNVFQLTIHGSFNANKCYQVSIKREGGAPCGSANSSGTDNAVVFADRLVVDISPVQQNADFKSADNWRIEIRERTSGCTGGSSNQVFPDSAGESHLRISGCNTTCMLSDLALTMNPNPVGCGGTVQACAQKAGGGVLGSGNLEYDWDIGGDGTCGVCSGGANNGARCSEAGDCSSGVCIGAGGFPDLITHTGDPGCAYGQPCCIPVSMNSTHTIGVKVRDLGCQVACADCKTGAVAVTNDCSDGQFCNGAEVCNGSSCGPGSPVDCTDTVSCTLDACDESTDSCTHTPNNSACGDGLYCNGAEICNATFGCQSGTPVNCADGVACTVDSCAESSDSCSHTPNNAMCGDGKYCNGSETCDATQGCKPGTTPNCNDNVACTVDSCDEGTDSCRHQPSNSLCNDSLWCNGIETCGPSGCVTGTPPSCDDGVACTIDTCDEANDRCVYTPSNNLCSDGQFCNGSETCHQIQGCRPGSPPNCSDGITCTTDSCNEASDACAHTPNNSACGDGQYCNGVEVCSITQGCQAGTPVNCVDGVSCTTDSCDESTDSCVNLPDNAACGDNLWCNGTEICSPTQGCQSGTPPDCNDAIPCTIDSCNESSDSCSHQPSNSLCGDGLYCNGTEVCSATQGCQAGPAPSCSDSVSCTVDGCDEATDSCTHTANNAACSDGLFCNGAEVCQLTQGCRPGTAPNCNDNINCTTDGCNESADQCTHTPNDAACQNGLFCDGQEICDPALGCQDNDNPCNPPLHCQESSDRCVSCTNNAQCNDGVFCNGTETCNTGNGRCVPGTPPTCNDGVPCTMDSCNTVSDSCENTPNHGACGDGLYCNGPEICHPTQGCQAGTPVACGDSVSCTVDSCDEASDACVHTPNNGACSDGQHCNGAEVCHSTLGCQSGVAPNCNDGVSCTIDSCNENTDSCTHAPDSSLCQDGLHCNGSETCSASQGCQAGAPPDCNDRVGCTVDSCDESTDSCAHLPSNSLCNDGHYCNGSETCHPTQGCQDGTAVVCNDGVSCTADTCNATTDSCEYTPNHAACSDGQHCNGPEVCHPIQGCQGGTPPDCDDHVACTADSCNESTDSCVHTPNDGACSDGAHCNGAEVCDPLQGCHGGTAPNCDDGVNCTVDACNEATDSCTHTPNNSHCGDGLHCNGIETCHPTLGCQTGTPVICYDNVSCTVDGCDESVDACVYTPDHTACGDGQHCNGSEYCHPTLGCRPGTPGNCDDGVPCTADGCDEATNSCTHTPQDGACDDGQLCNGVEFCHPDLGCQPGTPTGCSDGVDCTVDACDEATDSCTHTPSNTFCDDELHCNGSEVCHPTLGCQFGTGPNCDDGVSCTVDSCDEPTDSCLHVPDHNACDDLLFCNGDESCHSMLGCQDNPDPCAPPTICDESNGRCVECLSNAQCDDGRFCNGTETCNTASGACVPGVAPTCDDGLSCTLDSCNPGTNACVHAPDHFPCDDGLYCNGEEFCDATAGCLPGTPPNCDDGVPCSVDACDETNNTCMHTPNPDLCDDGLFCDGEEVCDPALGCQGSPDPCPASLCDEGGDRCVACLANPDCDNHVLCDGAEICNLMTGMCQPGAPPTCSDGVPCTVDTCSPAMDSCVNMPSDSACSDGLYCNGNEVCHATLGCQAGTPPNCNDGVGCTVDSCNEATDSCRNKPSDSLCADSAYCNGPEVCDPVNGCQPGTPPGCDDSVDCTVDSCDESVDSCVSVPNGGSCSDGLFCNGMEVCNLLTGCGPGAPPNCDDSVACTTDACNEQKDVCDHTSSHSVCSDGLFCNGTELCDLVQGCLAGTPPNCTDGVTCTMDRCDEASDSCINDPTDAACDDGQYCNGVESCDPVDGCQAGIPPNCGDSVGCTIDSCDESLDICIHLPNHSACDDGQYCNGSEVCDSAGGCGPGTLRNCDDLVDCTIDSCDEVADVCVHAPDHEFCSDGLFCNGGETCDVLLGCEDGTLPCDANDLHCDEVVDLCVECLGDIHCVDDIFCNGVATCLNGACVPGTPPNCNDGIACTMDACDPASDDCTHTPNDESCQENVFCNGQELCDPAQGCALGTPPDCDDHVPCTDDVCSPVSDSCVSTPNHDSCDDDLFCNGAEVCDPAQNCVAELVPNCDDGVACTVDSCDENADTCVHTPENSACSDGQYCNGAEVCDPINGCQPSPPLSCDDGVMCTIDVCLEIYDVCEHIAWDAACGDGQFCNGAEVCHLTAGCQAGALPNCNDAIPCTADTCNEPSDLCEHAPMNESCSDGMFFNGQEVCVPGVGCQSGVAPNCDDGVDCTADFLNPAADRCENIPQHSQCDDGLFCTGPEVCDPVEGCQPGTPPNCNDSVGCTADSCNEALDRCENIPQNALCDDGAYCNGAEVCTVAGCSSGPAPQCADVNECTVDGCDETADTCRHLPSAALCDDGLACTQDGCTPGGCSHTDVCGACCLFTGNCLSGVSLDECLSVPGDNTFLGSGSVCRGDSDGDGADDSCGVLEEIPTVSQWGLVVLALLLMVGAKLGFGAARQVA